jgi:hypothetical protein
MARVGINQALICKALNVDDKTMRRNELANRTFWDNKMQGVENVLTNLVQSATSGDDKDNSLKIFFAKTQARWSEHHFVKCKGFSKLSFLEQKKILDDKLEEGDISVENYQKLVGTITSAHNAIDQEKRIAALEAKIGQAK